MGPHPAVKFDFEGMKLEKKVDTKNAIHGRH